jgi:hypothetical protein
MYININISTTLCRDNCKRIWLNQKQNNLRMKVVCMHVCVRQCMYDVYPYLYM